MPSSPRLALQAPLGGGFGGFRAKATGGGEGSKDPWALLVLGDTPGFISLAAAHPQLRGRVVHTSDGGNLGTMRQGGKSRLALSLQPCLGLPVKRIGEKFTGEGYRRALRACTYGQQCHLHPCPPPRLPRRSHRLLHVVRRRRGLVRARHRRPGRRVDALDDRPVPRRRRRGSE